MRRFRMPVYLLENQSSKKPPEKRGAETVLLIDPPLHPNVTHDKRLPRPDTLLHMKAAWVSPHSCPRDSVSMHNGVLSTHCMYRVLEDGACCKDKFCKYSLCMWLSVKTWRLMLPVSEYLSIYCCISQDSYERGWPAVWSVCIKVNVRLCTLCTTDLCFSGQPNSGAHWSARRCQRFQLSHLHTHSRVSMAFRDIT